LTADAFNEISAPEQEGTIDYTDSNSTASPLASISSETISITNSVGTPIQLPQNEIAAIEACFTITAEQGNTNNGAIDWTFDPQAADLRFLPAGWNVVLSTSIEVADQYGSSDTSTVTVTLSSQLQYPSLVAWALGQTLALSPNDIPLAIENARAQILNNMRGYDSTNTAARDAEYYLVGLDAGYTDDAYEAALVLGTPVYNALKTIANLLDFQSVMQADPGNLNAPPGGTEAAYQGLLDGLSAALSNGGTSGNNAVQIIQVTPQDPPNVSASIPAIYDFYPNQEDSIYVVYANAVPFDNTDRIILDQSSSLLTIGNGNNYLIGGSAPINVTIGNGNNAIFTGAGGGTITVGSGDNLIEDGSGSDTVYLRGQML
jgi:hypothetical protein